MLARPLLRQTPAGTPRAWTSEPWPRPAPTPAPGIIQPARHVPLPWRGIESARASRLCEPIYGRRETVSSKATNQGAPWSFPARRNDRREASRRAPSMTAQNRGPSTRRSNSASTCARPTCPIRRRSPSSASSRRTAASQSSLERAPRPVRPSVTYSALAPTGWSPPAGPPPCTARPSARTCPAHRACRAAAQHRCRTSPAAALRLQRPGHILHRQPRHVQFASAITRNVSPGTALLRATNIRGRASTV